MILPRSFYARSAVDVAQELLGQVVVRVINNQELTGMIVETEAYEFGDEASHAFDKQTNRNRALFGAPGHAYIYTIHTHYCLNFVAHDEHTPAGGVLIRALEPLQGIEIMKKYRGDVTQQALTNGPGKLSEAFDITPELYGHDVTHRGPLYVITHHQKQEITITTTKRIGISKAQDKLWRFYIAGNKWISKK